jgi:hypothetical protein
MAKSRQTHAKQARELAQRERRERKRAKKEEAAAQRAAETGAHAPPAGDTIALNQSPRRDGSA